MYWSDTHQLSLYVDHYHAWLDRELPAPVKATEILVEFYVPRQRLVPFLDDARRDFREHG